MGHIRIIIVRKLILPKIIQNVLYHIVQTNCNTQHYYYMYINNLSVFTVALETHLVVYAYTTKTMEGNVQDVKESTLLFYFFTAENVLSFILIILYARVNTV